MAIILFKYSELKKKISDVNAENVFQQKHHFLIFLFDNKISKAQSQLHRNKLIIKPIFYATFILVYLHHILTRTDW